MIPGGLDILVGRRHQKNNKQELPEHERPQKRFQMGAQGFHVEILPISGLVASLTTAGGAWNLAACFADPTLLEGSPRLLRPGRSTLPGATAVLEPGGRREARPTATSC